MTTKINGKTPEEIKKGLEACIAGECHTKRHDCPYREEGECTLEVMEDALACIQQLEARIDTLTAKAVLFDEAAAAGERYKRERDAAVADIPRACGYCKHFIVTHNGCTHDYDCALSGCMNISGVNTKWEWRGVQE